MRTVSPKPCRPVFACLNISGCCVSGVPVQAQKSDPLKSRQQVDLERAHFLVTQAFDEDEKGNDDEAIELYTQAVELCINTVCVSLSFLSLKNKPSIFMQALFFCVYNSPTRRRTRCCRLS